MVFLSHKNRHKFVVAGHPRRKVTDPTTGITTPYPGLEARFMGHRFDSVRQQAEKGWTDEQRKTVENYLLQNREFDRPGGIFLETVDGESKEQVIAAAGHVVTPNAVGGKKRCVAWIRNERDESELCPKEATHGDLCATHAGLISEVDADEGEPVVEAPAAAVEEPPRRRVTLPPVKVG
jgi:hypothetical protein